MTNTVLVTGATGQQGGAVAHHLLGRGVRVRALTRNASSDAAKALAVRGAEIAEGDLDDVASIARALEGAWGVFSVQNTWTVGPDAEVAQGTSLAKLAREAGVEHFVYSSVGSAHRKTGIPHFESKAKVEDAVRGAGLRGYTILRPVQFMETLVAPSLLKGDELTSWVKPTTRVQLIAVDDIGRFASVAFARSAELRGAEIDIAGDAVTMTEAAAVLSKAFGRSIRVVQRSSEEARAVSEDLGAMIAWFDRIGYEADISKLEATFGFAPQTLAAWASTLPNARSTG